MQETSPSQLSDVDMAMHLQVYICKYCIIEAFPKACLDMYHAGLQVLDTVLAAGVPIAGLNGGGYDPDLTVLAKRHSLLHRAASQLFTEHGL